MYTLKTTITINRKLAVIGALIFGLALLSGIVFALTTGDINGFNHTYLG